jgi:vacuolar-type H+-ATPase subunit H
MLASGVNLLVDYLFIDILSAPVADSLKSSQTEEKPSPPSPHPLVIAKRSTFRESLLSDVHTRIVTPSLIDAHSHAMESFQEAMGDTQSEVEKACEQRKTQRFTRLTRIKSASHGNLVGAGNNGVGKSDLVPISRAPTPMIQTGVDVDDLFSALKEEIVEERSLIRRQHEKEAFNALWGYV